MSISQHLPKRHLHLKCSSISLEISPVEHIGIQLGYTDNLHISASYVIKKSCNPPLSELGLNSTSSGVRIHKWTRTQLNEFGCLVTSHELGLNSTSSDIRIHKWTRTQLNEFGCSTILVTCHLYPNLFLRFKRAFSLDLTFSVYHGISEPILGSNSYLSSSKHNLHITQH